LPLVMVVEQLDVQPVVLDAFQKPLHPASSIDAITTLAFRPIFMVTSCERFDAPLPGRTPMVSDKPAKLR
jgi:hypothetical protein